MARTAVSRIDWMFWVTLNTFWSVSNLLISIIISYICVCVWAWTHVCILYYIFYYKFWQMISIFLTIYNIMIDRCHATRAADQNEAYETEYSMLPIPTHFLYLVQTYYKEMHNTIRDHTWETYCSYTPIKIFPCSIQYNHISLSLPLFPFSQGSPSPFTLSCLLLLLHSHKTSSFQHSSPHYTETSLSPSLLDSHMAISFPFPSLPLQPSLYIYISPFRSPFSHG